MKVLILAILCSICISASAQIKPVYFFGNDRVSDSTKATAYGISGKLSNEELWVLKKYDLDNNLLMTGAYKDADLTISHGQFVYYDDISFFNHQNKENFYIKGQDRFISSKGAYEDGVMTGRWIGFFPDGKIRVIITYVKGIKHGAFYLFNRKGQALLSGRYANDLKEGEWISKEGRKEIKEVYHNGELQRPLKSKN
ncbi:hypothetical protein FQZ97_729650 [compost metagenome]